MKVFIMSHQGGDGATFYGILNQLSESTEIRPLNPKRQLDFGEKVLSTLGRRDVNLALGGMSPLLSLTKGMLTGQPRLITRFVDRKQVAHIKAAKWDSDVSSLNE